MERRSFVKLLGKIGIAIATAPVVVDTIFKAVEAEEPFTVVDPSYYEKMFKVPEYPATPTESYRMIFIDMANYNGDIGFAMDKNGNLEKIKLPLES